MHPHRPRPLPRIATGGPASNGSFSTGDLNLFIFNHRDHGVSYVLRRHPRIAVLDEAQFLGVLRPKRGLDHAWRNGCDSDTQSLGQRRERAHEAIDAVLGGVVDRSVKGRDLARDGGDVDDGFRVLSRDGGGGGEEVGYGKLGGADGVD